MVYYLIVIGIKLGNLKKAKRQNWKSNKTYIFHKRKFNYHPMLRDWFLIIQHNVVFISIWKQFSFQYKNSFNWNWRWIHVNSNYEMCRWSSLVKITVKKTLKGVKKFIKKIFENWLKNKWSFLGSIGAITDLLF